MSNPSGNSWVSPALQAGGAIYSAYQGNQAADAAADAAKKDREMQLYMYNQTRKDQKPWRQSGNRALNKLNNKNTGIGTFDFNLEADPGYIFARDEALKGTSRQFAAQGMRNSGNVLAALSDRGAGMASQYTNDAWNRQFGEYGDRLNRYQSMAGMGQTANANVGQAGSYAAQGVGNSYGNTAAAEYYRAGTNNNAVQGGIDNYLYYDYLNRNA